MSKNEKLFATIDGQKVECGKVEDFTRTILKGEWVKCTLQMINKATFDDDTLEVYIKKSDIKKFDRVMGDCKCDSTTSTQP